MLLPPESSSRIAFVGRCSTPLVRKQATYLFPQPFVDRMLSAWDESPVHGSLQSFPSADLNAQAYLPPGLSCCSGTADGAHRHSPPGTPRGPAIVGHIVLVDLHRLARLEKNL